MGLFFLASIAMAAQPAGEAALPLITRIRLQAQRNLTRLPNFTCLETIERSRRRLPSRRYDLIDIARVEVALAQGKELFAWPGSGRFDDRELRDLIPGGATGNGSFALHARAVFLGQHTVFESLGEADWNGKPAYHYRYNVKQPFSGFTLRNGERSAVIGYAGEFWALRSNLDLLRLTVSGVDVPAELEISAHQETLEYQRVPIGEADYLLPLSSEMSLTDAGGVESRNRTTFSACKQYGAESAIIFDAPEEGSPEAVAAAEAKNAEVREAVEGGLPIEIEIASGLILGKTAVGDALTARVARDVKRDKQTLIPKGAVLTGRVIHFERRGVTRIGSREVDVVSLGFDFDQIATKQWRAPLTGTLKEVILPPLPRAMSPRDGEAGRVIAGFHPSGHNLVVVYNDERLRSGLRLIWESRTGPLKRAIP